MAAWGRLFWRAGTGLWLGVQLGLFLGVVPQIFRVLPESQASRLLKSLFPSYYALGLVLGVVWLLGAVMLANKGGPRRRWVMISLALVNWFIVFWADRLLPAMGQLNAASAAFHALHQESVILSLVSFLLALAGLAGESWGSA